MVEWPRGSIELSGRRPKDVACKWTIVRQSAVTLSEPAFTVLHAHLQIDLSSQ